MGQQTVIHDVSIALHPGMTQWSGEAVYAETTMASTPNNHANVTRLVLTTHTGTHVDPPRHFIHEGQTIDRVPLDRWIGPCYVADVRGAKPDIEVADLQRAAIPAGIERLVLKTDNSLLWSTATDRFVEDFVAVSPDAARWIVDRGIRLVGIDYLSVGSFRETGVETHLILLGNDVILVEGLNLSEIDAGHYELLCMPLKIRSGDGAPARVALRGPLPAPE